ncbi:MAG TPA: ATP cone domain-containing protein [Planctomycetota bacterium]|jgi:hypothetical protein
MSCPEAVRKHDGRVVAYDSTKLGGSIARAVSAARPDLTAESARRLSLEIASAVGQFLVADARRVPASADIRAMAVQILRQTKQNAVADAYAEHARAASSLLWRMRVVEPGTPFSSSAGCPWDRRRLLESLRASGIARDPAGEVAREVERRIVALNQDRISAALIHAITAMVLSQRSMDTKVYGARCVAYSAARHVPRCDLEPDEDGALPAAGPALEAFWLQAVHSQDVVRVTRENLISLHPFPSRQPQKSAVPRGRGGDLEARATAAWLSALDPQAPEFAAAFREWCTRPTDTLWVLGDTDERNGELARFLAMLPASLAPDAPASPGLTVLLKPLPAIASTIASNPQEAVLLPAKGARALGVGSPITLNLAGLFVREALRDQTRATVRLAQTVALAAQAHREREEYFGLSPVRGRQLPLAICGLWNAAAWLSGESFECRLVTRNTRMVAATLLSVVRGAVETLRNETSMALLLVGSALPQATRQLWRRDREFFLRDGITLDPQSTYDGGPAVRLVMGAEDFAERIDFARAAGSVFDQAPATLIEVPLGGEADVASWRELLAAFAQAGVPRLQLCPGGSSRAIKGLTRAVRAHLEGFPLFEQMFGNG